MKTSSTSALAGQIAASDPSSPGEQRENLERIHQIRSSIPSEARSELTANLDLAATLTDYLVRLGGMGPKDVLGIITGLVQEVEEGLVTPAPATGPNTKRIELSASSSVSSLKLMGHGQAKHNSKLLGEILFRLGTISREQLEQARGIQHASGVRLGEALVTIGATDWDGITQGLGIQKQITGSK